MNELTTEQLQVVLGLLVVVLGAIALGLWCST